MRAHYYTFLRDENFPWELPDYMTPIGMNGYTPKEGLSARDFIGDLDNDGRLGDLRGQLTVMALIQNMPDDDMVIVSHYRRFLVPKGSYLPERKGYIKSSHDHPASRPFLLFFPDGFMRTDKSAFIRIPEPSRFLMLPNPITLIGDCISRYAQQLILEDFFKVNTILVESGAISIDFMSRMFKREQLHIGMLYGAPVWLIKKHLYPLFCWAAELTKRLTHHRTGNNERYLAYSFEIIISEVFFSLKEQYAESICDCETLLVDATSGRE